ncbi:MAG: PIN domain-containing protein [Nitrospirae bacterium]|nr:PIN domain-containing protein [Nitrospirota bacterium]
MNRLFLDANVLFTAAHNPDGKASLIISLGIKGAWQVYTSGFAVEEARRNISAKYPSSEKKFNELISEITIVSETPDAPYPPELNEKDRPVFQAAHACRASHLITGDIAHFGAFTNKPEETAGIIILTASLFLSSL